MLAVAAVVVIVAVVLSVLRDDSGSDDGLLAVLDVPSRGDTEAAFLLDGHPVFQCRLPTTQKGHSPKHQLNN